MSITSDLKTTTDKIHEVIQDFAIDLYDDIRNQTPVDTRNLQMSWSIHKPSKLNWVIQTNTMSDGYAEIIWGGRRTVNGKTYGSNQAGTWGPQGGDVLVEQKAKELQRKLDAI